MISFDWDDRKARSNLARHGVGFDEAMSVFYDENAVQFYDETNSMHEDRYILVGMSYRLRILVVVHCERNDGRTIRIISARKATRNECRYYPGAGA